MTSKWMDDGFRALYSSLLARAPKNVNPEELLRAARKIAEELLHACDGETTWEASALSQIGALRSPTMLHRPVRVAANIVSLRTPQLVYVPEPNGEKVPTVATSAVLQDPRGEEIGTLDVVGEGVVDDLHQLFRRSAMLEVLGRVIALPVSPMATRYEFVLQVEDVRATTRILDLLGATREERSQARGLLQDLEQRGESPLDYVEGILREHLQIVGIDDHQKLKMLLVRFPILQALSGGRLGHSSGKLHMLLAGPPGSGKKIPGLVARVLNPRVAEASASKISAAGLVGASYKRPTGWASQPGLIPQAHEGALVLQDAHAVTPTELHKLGPALQELIEDGVVRDSKAGGMRRTVSVGMVIDLNRYAQIDTASANSSGNEAPIIRLRPLLSRIDVVAEIEEEPNRAWDIGGQIGAVQRIAVGALDDEPWVRELRILVGHLRDNHHVVELDEVRPLMLRVYEDVRNENAEMIAQTPATGDLPVRLMISFGRLVAASARANARSVAKPADVLEAVEFIRLKLAHFSLFAPSREAIEASAQASREEYYAQYAGCVVHKDDLARGYAEATGHSVNERTVRRDMKRLGAKRKGKGLYLLPPSDEESCG